jgi:hypothetical protein
VALIAWLLGHLTKYLRVLSFFTDENLSNDSQLIPRRYQCKHSTIISKSVFSNDYLLNFSSNNNHQKVPWTIAKIVVSTAANLINLYQYMILPSVTLRQYARGIFIRNAQDSATMIKTRVWIASPIKFRAPADDHDKSSRAWATNAAAVIIARTELINMVYTPAKMAMNHRLPI